ncbi:MAG: FG-GAP-like repeat-containing protein [Candidatus Thiothrix putei]|uniref:FG-GAP-like repeat-containing protein n=1 Tax=Candidatus Thiothrix putei TaxID=3080811 RepID=A0AA95HCD1_9GAMM|nr:MAG: FG-GAP-like repeat-containing protein [Candidatus Thiothrix putei]
MNKWSINLLTLSISIIPGLSIGSGITIAHNAVVPTTKIPVAAQIEGINQSPPCSQKECAGKIPGDANNVNKDITASRPIAAGNYYSRGSNSQLSIPQNISLAEINRDGKSDFIQYADNKIFVSKTDFNKTGLMHTYLRNPIKRVITGDFHRDNYDQVCAITTANELVCYGTSTDNKELWWWFTQSNFIADGEDSIVGDFDGDGRDDILVYPRSGGKFRLYSLKEDHFFRLMENFDEGNLQGLARNNLQIRAADVDGNGRDDLVIINPQGQVLLYGSTYHNGRNTFWWAFTTNQIVGSNEQVTVARIDNNTTDDLVMHNKDTGATRFFKIEYANGSLPAMENVATGQINQDRRSLLFWGHMHDHNGETGAVNRDDAMVYLLDSNMFARSDARWDNNALQLTYWWAYTQHSPNNHAGWTAMQKKPLLFLKCKFADINAEPETNQFYRNLNNANNDYWRDISYGAWNLYDSKLVDEWQRMSITNAAWRRLPSRWERADYCARAYTGSKDGYSGIVTLVNGEGDAGNHGYVLLTPDSSNLTFMSHEVGHTFGWGHSFDDTGRIHEPDWPSQPGEYYDHWDIMSAMDVATFGYQPINGRAAGPEMNAPLRKAFIPQHRIRRFTLSELEGREPVKLDIAALNKPEANGYLEIRLGHSEQDYYSIEYRVKSGWDQGISKDTVLVHHVVNGKSMLIAQGGTERLPGSSHTFDLNPGVSGLRFRLNVDSFASEGYTATVHLSLEGSLVY